jgi:putative membrane protein
MSQQTDKHGNVHHAMDKLQDMMGGLVGRASASMVTSADAFVENAAMGDIYEVEAAALALRRASSPQVRELARMMLADHTTSAHHLQAALEMNETQGVKTPPVELDTHRRKMIENLQASPDDKFDAMYLDQQLLAHDETLTLLTKYYQDGDNAQLRSVAAGAAPVVYRHRQHCAHVKQSLAS